MSIVSPIEISFAFANNSLIKISVSEPMSLPLLMIYLFTFSLGLNTLMVFESPKPASVKYCFSMSTFHFSSYFIISSSDISL